MILDFDEFFAALAVQGMQASCMARRRRPWTLQPSWIELVWSAEMAALQSPRYCSGAEMEGNHSTTAMDLDISPSASSPTLIGESHIFPSSRTVSSQECDGGSSARTMRRTFEALQIFEERSPCRAGTSDRHSFVGGCCSQFAVVIARSAHRQHGSERNFPVAGLGSGVQLLSCAQTPHVARASTC